jgi:hypothetical protein
MTLKNNSDGSWGKYVARMEDGLNWLGIMLTFAISAN